MSSTVAIAVFVSVGVILLVLGHYYVWRKLVKRTQLPSWLRRAATASLLLAGVMVPVGFALSRVLPRDTIGPVIRFTYTWLGFLFYVVVLLALSDVPRLPFRVARWWWTRSRQRGAGVAPPADLAAAAAVGSGLDLAVGRADGAALAPGNPPDLARRLFLARAVAGTALAGAGAITAIGAHQALGAFGTPEVPVRLERLPAALSGFRIVLLTDLHVGPWLDRTFTERVVAQANALKPDLVAVTGDLVDGRVPLIGRDVAPLGRLEARYGAYFVPGNHEYYSGVEPWVDFVRQLGLRPLLNERVRVGDRVPGGATFDLAGVTDYRGGRFLPDHAPDYERAVAGRDPDRELVLLAHQPIQVDGATAVGAGLQLSGHTHGGQLWPFGVLTIMAQPYIQGLHRHSDRTQIYVSAGTGFWGPPMRVLAPPEIAVLVLTT